MRVWWPVGPDAESRWKAHAQSMTKGGTHTMAKKAAKGGKKKGGKKR